MSLNIRDGVLLYYQEEPGETEITLPDEVTVISGFGFHHCKNIVRVNAKNVRLIDWQAFEGCQRLESVCITDSPVSIKREAFEGCRSLKQVLIPKGVTEIGRRAFAGCTSLQEAVLPQEIDTIPAGSFVDCRSLKTVVIPEGVTHIEKRAFYGCTALSDIVIPDSVRTIGSAVFEKTAWLSHQSDDFVIVNHILLRYQGSEASVTIPDGIQVIGQEAFRENTFLTEVNFPDSLRIIDDKAFFDCTALKSIRIPNGVTKIGKKAFYRCTALQTVDIPSSVREIRNQAFAGTPWIDHYPEDYVVVGDGILIRYNGSDSVLHLPTSVKRIGVNVFCDCHEITEVVLPYGVVEIGWGAFLGCSSLKNVNIPDSVTTIGAKVFAFCSALTHLVIPPSVTTMGHASFSLCRSLERVEAPHQAIEATPVECYACFKLRYLHWGHYLVVGDPKEVSDFSSRKIQHLQEKGDYSIRINNTVKYGIALGNYLSSAQPEAEQYIRENLPAILAHYLRFHGYEAVQALLTDEHFAYIRHDDALLDCLVQQTGMDKTKIRELFDQLSG